MVRTQASYSGWGDQEPLLALPELPGMLLLPLPGGSLALVSSWAEALWASAAPQSVPKVLLPALPMVPVLCPQLKEQAGLGQPLPRVPLPLQQPESYRVHLICFLFPRRSLSFVVGHPKS